MPTWIDPEGAGGEAAPVDEYRRRARSNRLLDRRLGLVAGPDQRRTTGDEAQATVVEEVVTGQPKTEDTAKLAGQSAVRGATPLNFNHFKIPLLQNLVTRAIRDA